MYIMCLNEAFVNFQSNCIGVNFNVSIFFYFTTEFVTIGILLDLINYLTQKLPSCFYLQEFHHVNLLPPSKVLVHVPFIALDIVSVRMYPALKRIW